MNADCISFHMFARSPTEMNDIMDPSIPPGNLNPVRRRVLHEDPGIS
jgi:hypothetical protein